MADKDTKKEVLFRRIQISIAILAGLVTLVLGVYNFQKTIVADTNPGSVHVVIRKEGGAVIPGAHVALYDDQNSLIIATETPEDGSFHQKGLTIGGYIVKVSLSGYEPQVIPFQATVGRATKMEVFLKPMSQTRDASPIKSALEEVGASWIRNIGKPKTGTAEDTQS